MPAPRERLVVPGRELHGPGDWESAVGRGGPFVVEVGFGKDAFLLERAAARPELLHVGIERDVVRVGRFLDRAAEMGLGNVAALPVAAELALGSCFEDGSVVELHVYFPDPWPKARHARNRLVRGWFAEEAARLLAPRGRLHLATDDAPYLRQMLEVLEDCPRLVNALGSGRASDRPALGHETKFERLFRARGREVRHLQFVPAGAGAATMAPCDGPAVEPLEVRVRDG